ncbi:MAG: hypothetical protein UV63_C0063G0008 [Microgenomates group bacterium GW2011_GWC1_43_11]|uniref:DUF433 domain-containing protein n=2 Tax=Candidatus Gottesmaniibacteriota TaxID=1752720 RepID=A0A0G1INJ9_9BACT|nr:MAG: hypothetical protein UV63_C0063G0008 [Microgenomates group bacterium GW2011_GWC1_43_11]KKT34675.1 MAG: hypothetical protein UW22_C0068G0008 [Candidatus Gottesmanbacteria bacterium GW2011_GWB1_44_11c]KKT60991.1 MAG: hypothetical protein UW52_C0014G0021 [Candidatus Gottesmanbacteria bacterium GW2011_GWA1_44_24b]HCM82767.1 hypothetical protein [Patescibacteria group bacterium]
MKKYIISDPNILGGTPIIAGTRIPAKRILYLFRDGYTIEAIHEDYPQLSVEVIDKVIDEIIQNLEACRA